MNMGPKRQTPPIPSTSHASKRVRPAFKETDVYQYCLMKICTSLIAPLFRQLLKWCHPNWKCDSEHFKTYLVREQISEAEFTDRMNYNQKDDIRDDPFGKSWDITLTYYAIWYPWTNATDKLEHLITPLKNERNKVAHLRKELNENMYKKRCNAIHRCLENLLSSVRYYCPHVTQKEIDEKKEESRLFINEIKNSPIVESGFDPSRYEEYKRKMEEHKKCVKREGKDDLKERLKKRKFLEVPLFLELKKDLAVEELFVEMVLDREVSGNETRIEVKDLLVRSDSVYYLEGRAGVGKTSLIKYLCMVWTNENREVEGLENYELFLHMECRAHHISTFDQFVAHSMPSLKKKMDIDTLRSILYDLQIIIVVDGYDEKNKKSERVLSDLLELKKDHKFTLIVTSRPEATRQFYALASSHRISINHIKVLGIPKSKRTEFINKYALSMGCNDDVQPLLRYLQRTEHRLSDVWELPYNLSILATLWMNEPAIIDSITTSSELHWQMHRTYKSKLSQRLMNPRDTYACTCTCACRRCSLVATDSELDKKLEDFLLVLCEISVRALANNYINLPPRLYKTLLDKCNHLQIPPEEMVGAFLKPSLSETGVMYSYPHKGVIDFLTALYIYKRIDSASNFDINQCQQRCINELTLSSAPEDLRQQMKLLFDSYKLQSDSSGASSSHSLGDGKIRKILDEILGDVSENDLPKFHSMLLNLIGILYIEGKGGNYYNDAKKEALHLLQDTGVKEKDHWLRLLNDVKCDEFVATFIAQKTDVLKWDICITDANLFAYNSIFREIKAPLSDSLEVQIDLWESISDVGDFLSQVNRLKLRVTILRLSSEFRSSSIAAANFDNSVAIKELFPRCKKYYGLWRTEYVIHRDMTELLVRLPDEASYESFFDSLSTPKKLVSLSISFGADISPTIRKIPEVISDYNIFVTDIKTEEEAEKVSHVLRGFQRVITTLCFPRCLLSIDTLLDSLSGIRVNSINFPENLRPYDTKRQHELNVKAKALTQCFYNIDWLEFVGWN